MTAPVPGGPWHPGPEALERVDWLVRGLIEEGAAPGAVYGVVTRDGLVHSRGLGEQRPGGPAPTADTAFRIASMTKSFTSAAVLLLAERGALRLDDPVSRYVPAWKQVRPYSSDAPEVTVGMLLSMSSGLPTDDPWADRQEAMSAEAFDDCLRGGVRFVAAPGTAYEYSNLGFALLGRIVEAAAGVGYRDYVRDELLAPLGLRSTGFDATVPAPGGVASGHVRLGDSWADQPHSTPGVFSAIGGLFSTVADLATWVRWLADAFPARDGVDPGPLSRAARRGMQRAHTAIPPVLRAGAGNTRRIVADYSEIAGYGRGLIVEHDPRWGEISYHSGGYPGFGSHMRWHQDSGIGIVVLANGRYAPCEIVATKALGVLLEDAAAPSARVTLWPETVRARAAVDRLLRDWDEGAARDLFAENVEMDLDLTSRRASLAGLVARIGPLDPSGSRIVRSESPAHCVWLVPGAHGAVRCELRMHPLDPPRVETLVVRDAAAPGEGVHEDAAVEHVRVED